MTKAPQFDITCRKCPRLVRHLSDIRRSHPDYYARPVPSFGAKRARLFIVGLAPGMHGANRTGRPFTGDVAGILLYKTLFEKGFSTKSTSVAAGDSLHLIKCRVSNAVKCLPPQNKPLGTEVRTCNPYLRAELEGLPVGAVVVALGTVAHGAVLRALDRKPKDYPFGHGHEHRLERLAWLVDSYHCSRYNTQTKRLTEAMFSRIFDRVRVLMAQE